MPGGSPKPIGGYKVVYEYANRFVQDGYDVHIMMPMSLSFWESNVVEKLKVVPRYFQNLLTGKFKPRWFPLDERVKLHLVPSLLECFAPRTDAYIATSIHTSEYLNRYKRVSNNCKFYLIQDFENWHTSDERVIETYKFDMHKICISNWLAEIVRSAGVGCTVIQNGFDFEKFRLTLPIDEKNKFSIAMMYHKDARKGCVYSFEALSIVKQRYPQLRVELFGASKPSEQLPNWCCFHLMPSAELHNRIYNDSAIYIASSIMEGWGLTIGEAMMRGAAIVCSDTDGFKEMVEDGHSALISPIKDPAHMAENIIRLIEDDTLRCRIATNGYNAIQKFTWRGSYLKLKTIIGEHTA